MSAEELDQIAVAMGLDRFDPVWAGATMVVEGIPDFTHLPPSSRLQFRDGSTVTVDMLNTPCHLPAAVVDRDVPGQGRTFKAAADDLRGVTAWVERAGVVAIGDEIALFAPRQRAWTGATPA